jgi:hypothetical protein
MKIVSVVLFFLLCYVLNPAAASAQRETSGFTLSPPFKEITLEKDAPESSYFIEITNNNSFHQTLYLSVVDFGSLDESGGVAFLGSRPEMIEKKYSLASWVSLDKDVLEIEGKQSQKIKTTILNKESLSPGGHYAAVVASLNSQKQKGEEETVSLKAAFASLIFVKKTGGEKYQLDLSRKEILSRSFGFPTEIALRFQNSGNVHLVPRGTVTITDPRSAVVSKGVINPESAIILPESFRIYRTSLDKLDLPLLPGFYTVNIQYRYAGEDDFTRVPFPFFFPGIAGIAAFTIILPIIFSVLFGTKLIRRKKSIIKRRKK